MLPLLLLLPLPLAHQHGGQHGDHHGDGDDEHGDGLGEAQPRVHVREPVVLQHRRLLAGQVVVVVQEEPLDAAQLLEDSLQVALAVPRVPLQQDVGAVGVDAQERLEVDGGHAVVGQVEQRHAGERLEDALLRLADLVPGQIQDLQRAQHGEDAAPQGRQLVVLQVELPQHAHGGEGPHLDGVDAVAGQVQPLQAVQVQEAAAVQARQVVVGELQLPQERQADGETLRQGGDPVPAQVQLLQELQLREASVLHRADVVVLQQEDAQLAVFGEGALGDDRDAVVGQVEELGGGRDSAGQRGEERPGTDGELEISSTVAAQLAPAAAAPGGLRQQQHEEQEVLHGSASNHTESGVRFVRCYNL